MSCTARRAGAGMELRSILGGVMLTGVFAAPLAHAQVPANCGLKDDPVVAIPGCTALIENSGARPSVLSNLLVRRAIAYRQANRMDDAMADVNRAIEVAPTSLAYNIRATIHMRRGKLKDAL